MSETWEMYEMVQALIQAPAYHLILEGLLMLWVLWLLFRKSYDPHEKTILTMKEKEELIAEWQPEPLVPDVDENHPALRPRIVSSKVGKHVIVNGRQCINMATHNYLGMVENSQVEESALKSLRKYGVGSCGPRGFYGTVDVHLELEAKIAKFLGTEESVLYSYGFATIASAIPAYSKRGDVIFVDEGVNFAIQKGLSASRSVIRFFKHNSTQDLERLLKIQEEDDKKNQKKAKVTRRFLIVEGIYMNHGDLCPLPELVVLKNRYKVRLFIDESISLGVLGKTGRGVTEHFGVPVEEIDLVMASLEFAFGSSGGFCTGSTYVVDHQRLSGLGYCFSASLPPMLASAATAAIKIIEEDPSIIETLSSNAQSIHSKLKELNGLEVTGIPISPIKHLHLATCNDSRDVESAKLEKIVHYAWENGVALTMASYLEQDEVHLPRPSIRLTVNALLTEEDITDVVRTLHKACMLL
uniref:Serine palmitoyltransferase 1 n=1 Tax=Strigamia maritima TaxID=126957 RepID=T1J9G1_STRMM